MNNQSRSNRPKGRGARTGAPKSRIPIPRAAAKAQSKASARRRRAPKSRAVGGWLLSKLASLIPGVGSFLAEPARRVGEWAGEGIGSALGLGAYKVRRNDLLEAMMPGATETPVSEGSDPPSMNSKPGSDYVSVVHREFIGDIHASETPGEYKVTYLDINPGVIESFPWLRQIALAYKEWKAEGILYEFRSTTGEISSAPTPDVGVVIMATDYDSIDVDPFQNKLEMENTYGATSAKTTKSFFHAVECAPGRNVQDSFWVREGPVPAGTTIQLYDLGKFGIATQGQPVANQKVGELWCTFKIGFRKATISNETRAAVPTDYFYLQGSSDVNLFYGSPSPGPIPSPQNSLGGSIPHNVNTDVNRGEYRFPPGLAFGDYLMTLYAAGTASGPSGLTLVGENCELTAVSTFTDLEANAPDSSGANYFIAGDLPPALASHFMIHVRVHITGTNAVVRCTGAGSPFLSTDGGYLVVSPIDADIRAP